MTLEAIVPTLAEYVGKKIADRVFREKAVVGKEPPVAHRIETALASHVVKVNNWSSGAGFLRLPRARDVDSETIPLLFAATPRRFRSASSAESTLREDDVLSSAQHLLILGPPGAGKTTTLKRLARRVLTGDAQGPLDTFQVPLVIRLRDINNDDATSHPLLVAVARELGLKIQIPEERVVTEKVLPDGSKRLEEKVNRLPPLCEGESAKNTVPRVVNEINPILFLDGLDEAYGQARALIESDIELLLEAAQTYKVIVTCRSGEYNAPLGYMSTLEVCELQKPEIEDLSRKWLTTRAEEFLKKINHSALSELASRPLFLSHMLAIYDADGTLPEQPFVLYELIVSLMLREWDRERRIARRSRYSDFGPEKKRRFLAAVAYYLTYNSSSKVFSESDLTRIYSAIHRTFGLPPEESALVANEIESHTGLIVEAGARHYEFSHLTLQEYLCAEHLVRSPFPADGISKLLAIHPAPLAIATALSAEPTGWLSGVLLNDRLIAASDSEELTHRLATYLNRLEFENPIFVGGHGLGFCVLSLAFRHAEAISDRDCTVLEKYMARFLTSPPVRRSFIDVITKTYRVAAEPQSRKHFVAERDTQSFGSDRGLLDLPQGFSPPNQGKLLRSWLESNFYAELLFDGLRISPRR